MSIPKQIKRFEQVISKESRGKWTKGLERPSWEDFKQGRIAIRKDLVEMILDCLKKKQFFIITGPMNSGKTWLSYALGFELERQGLPFQFVDVDNDFDVDEIFEFIRKFKDGYYWIFENCHIKKTEIRELIGRIRSELEKPRFILTTRRNVKQVPVGEDEFHDIENDEKYEIQLGRAGKETVEHVKDIIETFIEVEKIREHMAVTDEEIESAARKWGCDLKCISLRLEGLKNSLIEGRVIRLGQVEDKDVFEYLWSRTGKTRLIDEVRQIALYYISALSQFEPLSVWSSFLYKTTGQQTVFMDLLGEGIIDRISWEGKDFFIVPESRAEWILRTIWYKTARTSADIKQIFFEYIKSKSPNWVYAFSCLYLSRDTLNELVKEITASVFNDEDIWNAIKGMVEEDYFFSLSSFCYFSQFLIWAGQKQKVKEIWYYVQRKNTDQIIREMTSLRISLVNNFLIIAKEMDQGYFDSVAKGLVPRDLETNLQEASIESLCTLCSIVFESNPQLVASIIMTMLKRLKSASARDITRALTPLSKIQGIVTLEEFFDSFVRSDWENIITNSSTFDSICHLLCEGFKKRGVYRASRNLAETLLSFGMEYLMTEKEGSLYRLYHIITRVNELSLDVTPFVNWVIQLDVNMLRNLIFIQKQRDAEGWHEEPRSSFLLGLNGIAQIAQKRGLKTSSLIRNIGQLETDRLVDLFSDCDLKVVNFFFSQIAQEDPASCAKIVEKGSSIWSDLVNSTLSEESQGKEQAYWFLWNIYRYNKYTAMNIAQNAKHLFSENIQNGSFSFNWLPPLFGILHLCGIKIERRFLEKIEIDETLQMIDELRSRERPSCTTIILSLIAIKLKMAGGEFRIFKEIINEQVMRKCIYENEDRQLGRALEEVLRNYDLG